MVAIVRPYQPSVTTNPTPFSETRAPNDRSGEMLGAAIADLGEAAWVMEDELATAHAYQTDAEWTDFLRQVQYGDGDKNPGYLQMKGADAINARAGVVGMVEEKYRELVQGLNPRVRAGAVRSMEARYQTFIRSANTHAASSASAARGAASAAREKASALAAYDALYSGDIDGFRQQAAAIRASIEENPKYAAASDADQRLMVLARMEPLYTQYLDEVLFRDGASAALAAADAAYKVGDIGPSTARELRKRLADAAGAESVVNLVDQSIATGSLTGSLTFGNAAPTPANTPEWANLPVGGQ